MLSDLKYAFRQLAKNPGFTAVAVLTLALGIGVNTAMFSVFYGVLLDPYPYAKSNEIWMPSITNSKTGHNILLNVGDYLEIAKLPAVASAMATSYDRITLSGDTDPELVNAYFLSGNALQFLGVAPVLGRIFTPADIKANGENEPVAVLSFNLWQRLFNGSPDAIGRTLIFDDQPHVVIGVMPPRFGWDISTAAVQPFNTREWLWLPLPTTKLRRYANLNIRLKPGITKEVAEQQLLGLFQRIARESPARFSKDGFTAKLNNLFDLTAVRGGMRSSLQLLFCATGFLLLIACTNVANLQLARGSSRSREIAVRLALGASRARLIRLLLTESGVLSLLGGALGVFFAFGLTEIMLALMPDIGLPNEARVTINGWVLVFSAGVSMFTGILVGLIPALQSTRPDLNPALKDGGRAAGGGPGTRTRNALVVLEVALSIVLLVGASLTIRGFVELQHIDLGFHPERTILLFVPLAPKRYTTIEQRNGFARNLLERVQSLPDVASAAIGILPNSEGSSSITIPGQPKPADDIGVNLVSADYFQTLGITLRAGRDFTEQEIAHGDHVALINESARKLWLNGENPIGRIIQIDSLVKTNSEALTPAKATKEVTVIGIVADTRTHNLRDAPGPAIFVPYPLRAEIYVCLMVRSHHKLESLFSMVRAELRALDREQPMLRPFPVDKFMDQQLGVPRFNMALFSWLAGIALALAAAGIYSVLSYSVEQRTREIGVRMALGAADSDILRLVIGNGIRLLVVGLAIGLAASIALAKILHSAVFIVPLLDPLALGAAAMLLSVVALLACYIPARRAAKVDPAITLRAE